MLDGISIKREDAVNLVLPARASCLEPCQNIRVNCKLFVRLCGLFEGLRGWNPMNRSRLHKTRELLVKQRTMSVNALRGHLSEFGIIAAKGIGRVDALLDLVESDTTLPNAARAGVKVLAQALEGLDKAIDDLEDEITNAQAQNEMTRLLYKVPGIGKIIASVIAASVPDPSVFKSGRDFTAWLGLTPRQNSSGGKQALGAITKQGNRYIRKLLVLGATSLLNVVGKRKGALRDWIVGLLAKKPARLVTVALANKLARILWAMMKTGESFRTEMFAKA